MNLALQDLPQVAKTLGVQTVLPASEDDYRVVLDYQRRAASVGYALIN